MRLLLDTYVLLWWRDDSPNLSPRAHSAIADSADEILVSAATLWEIIIKRGLGKLRFPDDLEDVLREESFMLMPIGFQHLRCLETLPFLHKDPFDRVLVAQATIEGAPLITNDNAILGYGAPILR
ncbi:MAG: type II toxin-antitoxin system VapC family toxin [Stellaceae bacterium]